MKYISDYDRKIRLLNDFTNDVLRDKEIVLNQDHTRHFLSTYIEISKSEPIHLNVRLVFIQSILTFPNFAYKNVDLVTANFFIDEFDKAVNEIENDKFGFVLAIVNVLPGKVVLEYSKTDGKYMMSECNWSVIELHIEDVAIKMGWDGNYVD